MYPEFLKPSSSEVFKINDKDVLIPKCSISFDQWTGITIKNTFGGKPCVNVDERPMFAELAIMTTFNKEGWQARWIETYGKSNKQPIFLTEWKDDDYKNQIHSPIDDQKILNILSTISENNQNSFSGCWDVLAWKNDHLIFAESKRRKKDRVRITQSNWLSAALKSNLTENNFLIVEWQMS